MEEQPHKKAKLSRNVKEQEITSSLWGEICQSPVEAAKQGNLDTLQFYFDNYELEQKKDAFIEVIHFILELKSIINSTTLQILRLFFTKYQEDTPLFINSIVDNRTPLHKAILHKNTQIIDLLVDNGADLYIIPEKGNSAFHLAMVDLNIFKHLLAKVEGRKDIPEKCGKVLYYAIFEKRFECLRLLLGSEFKQFINTTIMGVTPLHIAAGEGHAIALEELVNNGADFTICVQDDKISPLHVLAAKGSISPLKFIIQKIEELVMRKAQLEGEFIDLDSFFTLRTANSKMTPLHFAAFRGNAEALAYLLKKSITPIDYQSRSKMTPIQYATSEGHFSCVHVLLQSKPNVFVEDVHGNNVLVYAAYKNRYDCGSLLLDHINRYKQDFIAKGMTEKDLIVEKRKFLVISLVDFEKTPHEMIVHSNPSFDLLFKDIADLKKSIRMRSIQITTPSLSWNKMIVHHLRYENDIGKGTGVTRQWLLDTSLLLSNSPYFYSSDGGRTFRFRYFPKVDNIILKHVKLIGFFVALSILTNPIPFHLTKYIYKHLMGEHLSPSDFIEESILSHLRSLTHKSEEELEEMSLDFSTMVTTAEGPMRVSLIDNQDQLEESVKKLNVDNYVKRYIYANSYGGCVKEMMDAFRFGFYRLIPFPFLISKITQSISNIPVDLLPLFSPNELVEIGNETELNIEEWMKYTKYINCDIDSSEVKSFWSYVNNADEMKRRKLIEFISGSWVLPFGGFRYLHDDNQPFTIELSNNENSLPSSRTCFYSILLPKCENEEKLHQLIDYSITNFYGFQFV